MKRPAKPKELPPAYVAVPGAAHLLAIPAHLAAFIGCVGGQNLSWLAKWASWLFIRNPEGI